MRTDWSPIATASSVVKFKKLSPDAVVPTRAHPTDAGFDLSAAHDAVLHVGEHVVVDTGIAVALPPNTVGLVFVRSSMGFKHGVTLSNSTGVIDCGYTGPIKVSLHCTGWAPYEVKAGQRIAQLVVVPLVPNLVAVEVDSLHETARGEGGFGSSGV